MADGSIGSWKRDTEIQDKEGTDYMDMEENVG